MNLSEYEQIILAYLRKCGGPRFAWEIAIKCEMHEYQVLRMTELMCQSGFVKLDDQERFSAV